MSVHAEPISHANALSEDQLHAIEQGLRCRQLWCAVLMDALEPKGASDGLSYAGFLTEPTGAWAHSRRILCDAAGVDPDAFEAHLRRRGLLAPASLPAVPLPAVPLPARQPLTEQVLAHLRGRDSRVPTPELACALGRRQGQVINALRDLRRRRQVSSTPHGWQAVTAEQPHVVRRRAGSPRPLRSVDYQAGSTHSRLLANWAVGETCALAEIQQRAGLSELQLRRAIMCVRQAGHVFTNVGLRTFRRDR